MNPETKFRLTMLALSIAFFPLSFAWFALCEKLERGGQIMNATLYRSGAFWRLDFVWADMDKSLVFKTAKDARLFAKTWRYRVTRSDLKDR
jgi:hypothetical protein